MGRRLVRDRRLTVPSPTHLRGSVARAYVVTLPTGDAYPFPTRTAAERFAAAHGGTVTPPDPED